MQRSNPSWPAPLRSALRRLGIPQTRFLITIHVRGQRMRLWQRLADNPQKRGVNGRPLDYELVRGYRVSTSRFGVGQVINSRQTPLGLHRIARKIGGGYPIGTVFRGRKPIGLTWNGLGDACIAHRILWLEGLEPGFNRDGNVDSFQRYIYIHGVGDETTLARPASQGCIHVAAADLIPLYSRLPEGTLVWIAES
ncbi:MAG: L,D-transpeptidase [Gemmataceae bacterium]|nr:L,D-transpeptidase [Gemmataceae bacterium]